MEDIKDKEYGTGDKKTAGKASDSKVTKKSCQSSKTNVDPPCEGASSTATAEENSNTNRDESEGETTELRRSKRARNKT